MSRIERIAAVVVVVGVVGVMGTTALVAKSSADARISSATPLSAELPIATILIMQDARAVAAEHARMGVR